MEQGKERVSEKIRRSRMQCYMCELQEKYGVSEREILSGDRSQLHDMDEAC